MKLKYLAVAAMVLVFAGSAFAQEGETQVVDEVVAQVNDDVITLSMLKKETKDRIEGCLDITAGAVLVASLTAAAIGVIVFGRKLLILFHCL